MATQIDPQNVVGRDQLIAQIWKMLAKGSVRFTAERRVGKTTVMTKMAAEPHSGFEVLYIDLEGIDSPERFVELLVNRLQPLLSRTDQAKRRFQRLFEDLGGTEVAGLLKLPEMIRMGWQNALAKTLSAVCEHQTDVSILLLMDELPYMLQKIATIGADGQQKILALTLLDTLRSIRQQHRNMRMVFAGSVGLHHVVEDLKQGKLASEPVNDMPLVEIRSLSESDAVTLAERLLRDESVQIPSQDRQAILKRLVELTDCVPFYIERICCGLGQAAGAISISRIEQAVDQQLLSAGDPWQMEHFRDRLGTYYAGQLDDTLGRKVRNEDIARLILDHMALAAAPQSINEIWAVVVSRFSLTDRNHIVKLLNSLELDHYLMSDTQRKYSFRFPLIQRWWRTVQGLES
ncbi:MAG: hypothetical protein ACKOEO_06150 [Planctomycetaceae bacterium]